MEVNAIDIINFAPLFTFCTKLFNSLQKNKSRCVLERKFQVVKFFVICAKKWFQDMCKKENIHEKVYNFYEGIHKLVMKKNHLQSKHKMTGIAPKLMPVSRHVFFLFLFHLWLHFVPKFYSRVFSSSYVLLFYKPPCLWKIEIILKEIYYV